MENEQKLTKIPEKRRSVYELVPPDGGWGYIIALGLTISFIVTICPTTSFGILYGEFLGKIGDETTGTTISNSIFNTVLNFTGLIANHVLQRFSFRLVAVTGSLLFFIGNTSLIFVQNLWQMVLFFGVIQGIGMGLIIPAFYSSLNTYFDKKLNLLNALTQAAMVASSILFPYSIGFLKKCFGFRGAVAVMAALSLNSVFSSMLLQPVEKHMKKQSITTDDNPNGECVVHLEPLIDKEKIKTKPRPSVISIGVMSVNTIELENRGKSVWEVLVNSFDLQLFGDLKYVNLSVGLSLAFTSDIAFISIIPLILHNSGLNNDQTTLIITIYFVSDLVGRIALTASVFRRITNRKIVLNACILSAIFRTAFVVHDTFWWKVCTLSALGFLRAFIQTPSPLVISEEYSNDFVRAFSLYMVVCGVVSLMFGPLMSYTKALTNSDVIVVHLLTLAFLICIISWILESVLINKSKKVKNAKEFVITSQDVAFNS